MNLSTFSKERMRILNKTAFPSFDLPMNLKTLWIETVDLGGINNISKVEHAHSFFEVHFVLSGNGIYWWDDQCFEIKSGQAFIIPAQKAHKYISCSDDILKTAIAFSADAEFLAQAKIFDFDSEILGNLEKIFAICEDKNIFTNYIISCKTTEILYSVLRSVSASIPQSSAAAHDPRFLVAKAFIENNVDKKITCLQVANERCLSPKQLNRIFCKETGKSVSNYINYVKIMIAKSLLTKGELSIKEICFMVGFENESNFISFFKKQCSITPGTFRKQMSQK